VQLKQGYGDLTPATTGGQLFASVFSLVGTVLIGLVLGVVGSDIVETQISLQESMNRKGKRAVEEAFNVGGQKAQGNPLTMRDSFLAIDDSNLSDSDSLSSGSVNHQHYDEEGYKGLADSLHWPAILLIGLGGLVVSLMEKWNWHQIWYFTAITATTVGLGDLTPSEPWSKMFSIVYIPLSVAIAAFILSNIASSIIDRRRTQMLQKLWSTELTIHDIEALDEDNSGDLNQLEYIRFMLAAMEKVDRALFDDLIAQFNAIDITGDGRICKKDIEAAALQKLNEVPKKLELATYKRNLTRKGEKRSLFTAMGRMSGIFKKDEVVHVLKKNGVVRDPRSHALLVSVAQSFILPAQAGETGGQEV